MRNKIVSNVMSDIEGDERLLSAWSEATLDLVGQGVSVIEARELAYALLLSKLLRREVVMRLDVPCCKR